MPCRFNFRYKELRLMPSCFAVLQRLPRLARMALSRVSRSACARGSDGGVMCALPAVLRQALEGCRVDRFRVWHTALFGQNAADQQVLVGSRCKRWQLQYDAVQPVIEIFAKFAR